MKPCVVCDVTSTGLGESISVVLDTPVHVAQMERFRDGEIGVEIDEGVRGNDAYIVHVMRPAAVADDLLKLLLLTNAVYRNGAARITAVLPYLPYARQDRRVSGLEPVGGRLIADLLQSASIGRVVTLELHNPSLAGFFRVPVENVSTVGLFVDAAKHTGADVVVAPDLGAAKLAEAYAAALGLRTAVVHKSRLSGAEVQVQSIVGDVRDRRPLIVDDMISTAGTLEAATDALLRAGCARPVSIAATHGILVGAATERLRRLPLEHLWLTNSIPLQSPDLAGTLKVIDIGALLAEVVRRLHHGCPVADLLVHR